MELKKFIKYYGILWIFGFIIFNVVTFVIPHNIGGINRFEHGGFWVGYIIMVVAFLGQLLCAYLFFKNDTKEKVFLSIPIIKVAKSLFTISVIVAIIFTVIPVLPVWIGSIICLLVMFSFALSCVKAVSVADMVNTVGEKVEIKTSFMRSLRADAESLIGYAKTEEAKKATNEIYEALRYSDPVSSSGADEIEQDIFDTFAEFSTKIKNEELEDISSIKDKILSMIKERNIKVKSSKKL